MAPLAPRLGTLASCSEPQWSVTQVCAAVAASPAATYQQKKRTRPSASSTLLPKIQRKSMLPMMCDQLACMNIELNAPSYHGRWPCGAGAMHGGESEHG